MMLVLAGIRVFVLPLHESPKWLLAMGRDEAAVNVILDVARINGVTSSLTLETLQAAAAQYRVGGPHADEDTSTNFTMWQLIKMSTSDMKGEHIRALFRGKRLALNTSLIIFICELTCVPIVNTSHQLRICAVLWSRMVCFFRALPSLYVALDSR